jgi:ribosome-associated translation inhibitor RaiA
MKSIVKHNGGADIQQIIDDLNTFCPEKERVFECVAVLMETGIISFSLQHFDFIFSIDTAFSPLAKALTKSKMPLITVEEYLNYGWRKIAGLM